MEYQNSRVFLGIILAALTAVSAHAQEQAFPDDQLDPAALPGDQFNPADQFRSSGAPAQGLILHLPLDGDLAYSGRTGTPRFIVSEGASQPVFVAGRYGQGLLFDGPAVVAAPFNLDHADYPQVTVTAWVRREADDSGTREVFSSGSTAGIRMAVGSSQLTTRVGGRGVSHGTAGIPTGEWVFVAVVVDTTAGSARMFVNDEVFQRDGIDVATKPPTLYRDPDDPSAEAQPWVIVGANSLRNFGSSSRKMVIDDLRVYAGALSDEQIGGLRELSAQPIAGQTATTGLQASPAGSTEVVGPGAPVGATQGGSLADSDSLPTTCNNDDDCPDRTYCAIERVCHPDRHAPLASLQLATIDQPLNTLPSQSSDASADVDTTRPARLPRPVGPAHVSSVSGEQGKPTYSMDLQDKFLTTITWWEKNDRPCGIRIEGAAAGNQGELTKQFFDCGSMLDWVFDQGSGMVDLPAAGMTADFAGRGIGALQVCSNTNNNRRMKGLRISGDWIGTDASIHGSNLKDTSELPNCRQWQTTVLCGQSQLATGLIVHITRASGRNEQIVGLQLICRAIALDEG